ncbi:hypothetical protein bcgnr5390_09830 [Bacillus luti]|nr:hypothetical protein BC2903_31080 [Bacillus cereus]
MTIIEFDTKAINKKGQLTLTFVPSGQTGTKFGINVHLKELMEINSSTHILPKYDDEKEILTLELNKDRGIDFTDSVNNLKRQTSASAVFNAMSKVMNIEHKQTLMFECNNDIITCKVPKRIEK